MACDLLVRQKVWYELKTKESWLLQHLYPERRFVVAVNDAKPPACLCIFLTLCVRAGAFTAAKPAVNERLWLMGLGGPIGRGEAWLAPCRGDDIRLQVIVAYV